MIQGTTGYHEAKAKGYQRHCFTCVVLHKILIGHITAEQTGHQQMM